MHLVTAAKTTNALLLTALLTSGGTALYLLAPATAPVILALSLVLPLTWYWRTHGNLSPVRLTPTTTILVIGTGYAFLNATWSPARIDAYYFAATLLVITICAPLGVALLCCLGNNPAIRAMSASFLGAFVVASAILCFEVIGQSPIHRHLVSIVPSLWPNSSRGELPAHFLNHKMVGLALMFWPATLAARHIAWGSARRAFLLLSLLPATIAIAVSDHQTSQIALLISALVYVAFVVLPGLAHRTFRAAWVIACLAVVPLCLAAYAADLHKSPRLQASAQHRIVIWKATSDRVLDAPLLGSGIHSSRIISQREPAPLSPGTPYRLSVSWHSHNAFLQVWSEAGAVGAAILLSFGFLAIRSISRWPPAVQPTLFATFACCAMISATGYSAFAAWLSASFALASLFASLVATLAANSIVSPSEDAAS